MNKKSSRWNRRWLPGIALVLVTTSGLLFGPAPGIVNEALSQQNAGYMLMRVILSSRETIDSISVTHVETNETVRLRQDDFQKAGLNAWVTLVPLPAGRYFLSEYVPRYGITLTENQAMTRRYTRSEPGSTANTFEIAAGVVNYVGDWTLRFDTTRQMRFDPNIEFDKSTLELYLTEFPEQASEFEIYLSPLGQNAISINQLAQ